MTFIQQLEMLGIGLAIVASPFAVAIVLFFLFKAIQRGES